MDTHFNLLLNVIESDSDNSTRPVSLEVNTPEEIDGNINPTITYGKVSIFIILTSLSFLTSLTFFVKKCKFYTWNNAIA